MCLFLPETWDKENGVGGSQGTSHSECCLRKILLSFKPVEKIFSSLPALTLSLSLHRCNQASRMRAYRHDGGRTYLPEQNAVKELGLWSETAAWHSRSERLKLFIFHNKGSSIFVDVVRTFHLVRILGDFFSAYFFLSTSFLVLKINHCSCFYFNLNKNKQFEWIFPLLYAHCTWYHITERYGHTSISCMLSLNPSPNPILSSSLPSPLLLTHLLCSLDSFAFTSMSQGLMQLYRIYASIKQINKPRTYKWKENVCFSESGLIWLIRLFPVLSILLKTMWHHSFRLKTSTIIIQVSFGYPSSL